MKIKILVFTTIISFSLLADAAQVKRLIPNLSLAKKYNYSIMEKSGDFNKSEIRVLVIKSGRKVTGIKVAGHAQSFICAKASKIIINLSSSIERRGAQFGSDYYISYGIFNGPIDRKYSPHYLKALDQLKKLERTYPGKVTIKRIDQNNFNRIQANIKRIDDISRNNKGVVYISLHHTLENYFSFVPFHTIDQEQYSELLEKIKEKEKSISLNTIKSDIRKFNSVIQLMKKTRMVRYITISDNMENSEQERNLSHFNSYLNSRAYKNIIRKNTNYISRLKKISSTISNKQIGNKIKVFASILEIKMGKKYLQFLARRYFKKNPTVTFKTLVWTKPEEDLNNVDVYISAYKSYFNYKKMMRKNHPHMLADSIIRFWPVKELYKHKDEYKIGLDIQKDHHLKSQYNFVAGNTNKAIAYTSLSGKFIQVSIDGKSMYVHPEDFIKDDRNIPTLKYIAVNLIKNLPDKNLKVFVNDNPDWILSSSQPDFKPADQLTDTTYDMSGLTPDFLNLEKSEQLEKLKEIFPDKEIKSVSGGFSGASLFSAGNLFIKVDSLENSNNQAEKRVRHGIDRIIHDPAFRKFFRNISIRVPVECNVTLDNSAKETLTVNVQENIIGYKPVSNSERSVENKKRDIIVYQKFHLNLSSIAGTSIFGSKDRDNMNSYYTKISQKLEKGNEYKYQTDERPQIDEKFSYYINQITSRCASLLKSRKTIFQHDTNPANLLVNRNGSYAVIDFDGDEQVPVGVHISQVLTHSLIMKYGTTKRISNKTINKELDYILNLAVKSKLISRKDFNDPLFKLELLIGVLRLSTSDSKQREYMSDEQNHQLNRNLKNIRQPLFEYILNTITESGIKDRKIQKAIFNLKAIKNQLKRLDLPYIGNEFYNKKKLFSV